MPFLLPNLYYNIDLIMDGFLRMHLSNCSGIGGI